ncbi:hypothetical protein JCM10212_004912 [Sporobolomyces blumeae]
MSSTDYDSPPSRPGPGAPSFASRSGCSRTLRKHGKVYGKRGKKVAGDVEDEGTIPRGEGSGLTKWGDNNDGSSREGGSSEGVDGVRETNRGRVDYVAAGSSGWKGGTKRETGHGEDRAQRATTTTAGPTTKPLDGTHATHAREPTRTNHGKARNAFGQVVTAPSVLSIANGGLVPLDSVADAKDDHRTDASPIKHRRTLRSSRRTPLSSGGSPLPHPAPTTTSARRAEPATKGRARSSRRKDARSVRFDDETEPENAPCARSTPLLVDVANGSKPSPVEEVVDTVRSPGDIQVWRASTPLTDFPRRRHGGGSLAFSEKSVNASPARTSTAASRRPSSRAAGPGDSGREPERRYPRPRRVSTTSPSAGPSRVQGHGLSTKPLSVFRDVASGEQTSRPLQPLSDRSAPSQSRLVPNPPAATSTNRARSLSPRPLPSLLAIASPSTSNRSRSPSRPVFRLTTTVFDDPGLFPTFALGASTRHAADLGRPSDLEIERSEMAGHKEGEGEGMESTFVLESFLEDGDDDERGDGAAAEDANRTGDKFGDETDEGEGEGGMSVKGRPSMARGVATDDGAREAQRGTDPELRQVESAERGESDMGDTTAQELPIRAREVYDKDPVVEGGGLEGQEEQLAEEAAAVLILLRADARPDDFGASPGTDDDAVNPGFVDFDTLPASSRPLEATRRSVFSNSFLPPRRPRPGSSGRHGSRSSSPEPLSSSEDELAYLIRTTATHSSEDDLPPSPAHPSPDRSVFGASSSDSSDDSQFLELAEREVGKGLKLTSDQRGRRIRAAQEAERKGIRRLRIGEGKDGRRLRWKRHVLDVEVGQDAGARTAESEDELGLGRSRVAETKEDRAERVEREIAVFGVSDQLP